MLKLSQPNSQPMQHQIHWYLVGKVVQLVSELLRSAVGRQQLGRLLYIVAPQALNAALHCLQLSLIFDSARLQ